MSDIFDMFKETPEEAPASSTTSEVYFSSSSNLFVVSIGGSVICEKSPNASIIMKIASMLNELNSEGYKFVITVGGGKTARNYIAAAKSLGANNFAIDEIAIAVTRTNAKLFIQALENAHLEVMTDVTKAREVISNGKIPVYGGLIPGFTTDTVAALLAESLNAKFVNITNTDGIYNADPKKTKAAKQIPKMTHSKLLRIVSQSDSRAPGSNVVLDAFTAMVLQRSKITSYVVSAEDLENVKNAIRGQEFEGTLIKSPTSETEPEEDELDEI